MSIISLTSRGRAERIAHVISQSDLVRRDSTGAGLWAVLLASILIQVVRIGVAHGLCLGDIDGDQQVTAGDVLAVIAVVAGEKGGDPVAQMRADVNGDGVVTAGDIIAILPLVGPSCLSLTPRPTPTATPSHPPPSPTSTHALSSPIPTATPTPTLGPPTATPTSTPTATPTQVCAVQNLTAGAAPVVIPGQLTPSSCDRVVQGQPGGRVDLYSVVGTPGTAIKIDVVAIGPTPITPFVVVTDAGGQFGAGEGSPPIQFFVSTTQPYEFMVASSSVTAPLGPYTLTLTSVPCPTPVALTAGVVPPGTTLLNTACPDPGAPSTKDLPSPADVYTFVVSQVPKNVSIKMKQSRATDSIQPLFSVRGPSQVAGGAWFNGIEVVSSDNYFDCTPDTGTPLCAGVRFLALEPGSYTIIAGGGGGTGQYTLSLSTPACSIGTLNFSLNNPLQKTGTLTASDACAAPLPIPGISDGAPADTNSPADLYTFTANAGDVISVLMASDDDAHLYILGPSPDNPLVAQDDDSGEVEPQAVFGGESEFAATLVKPGIYTIVAANNEQVVDPSTPVNYTLYAQKCPQGGVLSSGQVRNESFTESDCLGFGGMPYRSYGFTGHAGQFITASMASNDVDAFVRILGPDGSVVQNDSDPFQFNTPDARASRILQQDGTYFIEVSTSIDAGQVFPTSSAQFAVDVETCPTKPAVAGPTPITGTFAGGSCTLSSGQKFDVYAFKPAAVPSVASILPPSNGCVLNLLAEGPQTPDGTYSGCGTQLSDMPLLMSNGTYGFVIAANDASTTGAYTANFRSCAMDTVGLGQDRSGTLSAGSCAAADGTPANWFLVRASADLVRFNAPVAGSVFAGFPIGGALIDVTGSWDSTAAFNEDPSPPDPMFQFSSSSSVTPPPPFGGDLAFLLRITGAGPSDRGQYTLEINPPAFR
jgi:Dockerin type I domain